MKTLFLFLSILFLFSGCSIIDSVVSKAGYDKRTKVENRISDLKAERAAALEKQAAEINKSKDEYYKILKENFQQSINWTYGASLASNMKSDKTRLDNVLDYRLSTALSFGPPPTPEAILYQNKLLKEELDEKKVSDEALAKRYEEKEKEAQAARISEAAKAERVKALEEKIPEIERQYTKHIESQQDKLNSINGDLLALKEKQLQSAEESEHLKKVIMGWLFAGAAACAIGAYFFRAWELAVGAIVCAGIAIAIPFIKTWMVITGICAVVVLVGLVIYKKFDTEKNLADRALGTIQERRNEAEDDYQKNLKPKLDDWFKDAPGLHKVVEKRLRELNVK